MVDELTKWRQELGTENNAVQDLVRISEPLPLSSRGFTLCSGDPKWVQEVPGGFQHVSQSDGVQDPHGLLENISYIEHLHNHPKKEF